MDRLETDFEALLSRYRQAVDEPEPSVNFMPGIWQRIESRRTFTFRFRRLAQVFVGAAAVLCLLIAGVSTVIPGQQMLSNESYLDVLADAHPADNLAAQGIMAADANEAGR